MASHITRRLALIGACCATALCTVPSIAFASKRFSVDGFTNETQANLTISHRWAEEAWRRARITPGAKPWFSWQYPKPAKDWSPDFQVVLDFDSSASEYKTQKLRGFAAEEQNFDLGDQYAFRHGSLSKRHIELWDISPPGAPASSRPPQVR
jgi:hypothetical protein